MSRFFSVRRFKKHFFRNVNFFLTKQTHFAYDRDTPQILRRDTVKSAFLRAAPSLLVFSAVWALLASSCIAMPRIAKAQVPNTPIETAFPDSRLSIPGTDWTSSIDVVAKTLKMPVVALVPEHPPVLTPTQRSGRTSAVLHHMATVVDGRWHLWRGKLVLAPLWLPKYFQPPATRQNHIRDSTARNEWGVFLASLSENHLHLIEKGQRVPIKDLTPQQMVALAKVGKSISPDVTKLLASHRDGELSVQLGSPEAFVFWKGHFINGNPAKQINDSIWHPQDFVTPDLESLYQSTAATVKSGTLHTVQQTQTLSLQQTEKYFSVPEGKLHPAQQVGTLRVVVSSGNWKQDELLTLIQAATHTQVRKVGGSLTLAPDPKQKATANALGLTGIKDIESPVIRQVEIEWQNFLPVVQRLAKSPLSKTTPVTLETITRPQLMPYHQLSNDEQLFVNTEAWPEPPTTAMRAETDGHNLEVYFSPVIKVGFHKDEKSWFTGFSTLANYPWLYFRTMKKQLEL
jgi:hypothetical protein